MKLSHMTRSIATMAAIVVLASPAFALDLQSARSTGALGEKNDGYVAVLKPSAEANALAAEVNAGRKAEYTRISKENGQPVNVVAKVAAEAIINKISTGSSYQDSSGNWKTK